MADSMMENSYELGERSSRHVELYPHGASRPTSPQQTDPALVTAAAPENGLASSRLSSAGATDASISTTPPSTNSDLDALGVPGEVPTGEGQAAAAGNSVEFGTSLWSYFRLRFITDV